LEDSHVRKPPRPWSVPLIAAVALLLAIAAPVAGFNPDTEVTVRRSRRASRTSRVSRLTRSIR